MSQNVHDDGREFIGTCSLTNEFATPPTSMYFNVTSACGRHVRDPQKERLYQCQTKGFVHCRSNQDVQSGYISSRRKPESGKGHAPCQADAVRVSSQLAFFELSRAAKYNAVNVIHLTDQLRAHVEKEERSFPVEEICHKADQSDSVVEVQLFNQAVPRTYSACIGDGHRIQDKLASIDAGQVVQAHIRNTDSVVGKRKHPALQEGHDIQ